MTRNDRKTKCTKAFYAFSILFQCTTLLAAPVDLSLDPILQDDAPDLQSLPITMSTVQPARAAQSSLTQVLNEPTTLLDTLDTLDTVSATSIVLEDIPIELDSSSTSFIPVEYVTSSVSALTTSPSANPISTPDITTTDFSSSPTPFSSTLADVPTVTSSPSSFPYSEASRPSSSSASVASLPSYIFRGTLSLASSVSPTSMTSKLSKGTLTAQSYSDVDTSIVVAQVGTPTSTAIIDPGAMEKPYNLTTHRQIIILSCILLVLFSLVVISFIVAKTQNVNWWCRRRKLEYDMNPCMEKDMVDSEKGQFHHPWSKLNSQNSIANGMSRPQAIPTYYASSLRSSLMNQPHTMMQDREIARLKNRVLDIVPDFPRSRFSVTSSDLGEDDKFVIGEDEDEEDEDEEVYFAPLLSPEEFFSLPSSSTIASRHSRRNSAPVFGRKRRIAGLSVAEYRMSRAHAEYRLSRAQTMNRKSTVVRSGHRKSHSVGCLPGGGRF